MEGITKPALPEILNNATYTALYSPQEIIISKTN